MSGESYLITESLPASATIEQLRYKNSSRYWARSKKFPKAARQACENAGIETVSDLEGWSKDGLTDLSGIGRKSARRLLQAADNAQVDYRGNGFPWELTVTIEVPLDRLEEIREHSQEEVEDALSVLLSTDDLFDDVEASLREARRKELEQKRAEIEAELEDLSDGS